MNSRLADFLLPTAAIAAALGLFGVFVSFAGASPVEVWLILFKGAFGDWFSWQNTLQRAAPLMLTALCVAIPARAGLTIIGGEGALVLGGLAGAVAWDVAFYSGRVNLRLFDPSVLIPIAALLALATVAACLVPARHATRLNPVEALRGE